MHAPARPPLRSRLALALASLAVVTGSALAATDASAGDGRTRRGPREGVKQVDARRTPTGFERNATWTGNRGQQASRQDVVTRTGNGRTRQSTLTGPNGGVTTQDSTVTRDPVAGTRTREQTTTGPNGRTASTRDVTTRTDDGYTRATVVTNTGGGTLTRDVVAAVDPAAGTASKTVTVDRTPAP